MHKIDEILENYCERIEKELGDLYTKISKSDTLSAQDLDAMNKLLHSLKSNKTVWAMIEYDDKDEGYSGNGYSGVKYPAKRYYADTRGVRSGGMRNYSRDTERDDMVRKLEDMMRSARTDNEAMALQRVIDTVNSY